VPIVLKSWSLNLLEPSGPVKACNGIALPLLFFLPWVKYCEDFHNDSTSLRGPNIEPYTGVSMACPVQDRWVWVWGRSLAVISGSIPAEAGMFATGRRCLLSCTGPSNGQFTLPKGS
jgi:hypothetical protein